MAIKHLIVGLALAALVAVACPIQFAHAQTQSGAGSNALSVSKGKSTSKYSPESIRCPQGGILPQPISVSHHKVMLSWNPSPSPSRGQTGVAGYCLYRTQSVSTRLDKANCTTCEQINAFAYGGNSCVDFVVEDSTSYQYVVAAIDKHGQLSSPSNWAPAPIPDADHPGPGRIPIPTPPACRIPPSSSSNTTPAH